MRFAILLPAGCGLVALALAFARGGLAEAVEKPPRLLRHVVMYKFRDDLTAAELQEVVDAFGALPKKINVIAGYEHGTNVSAEGKSDGLTHAFMVSFRSEQDRDTYLMHPAHVEYVKLAGPRREKVIVFDYWSSK